MTYDSAVEAALRRAASMNEACLIVEYKQRDIGDYEIISTGGWENFKQRTGIKHPPTHFATAYPNGLIVKVPR